MRRNQEKEADNMNHKRLWCLLFAGYCAVMLWLLFHRPGYEPGVPYPEQLRYNLQPFRTIGLFLRLLDASEAALRTHAVINLVGNVVMFIPLGLCMPRIWPGLRRFGKFLLTVTVLIAAVELIQMLTLVGSCDTDDLILNLLGAAVGFGLFRLWGRQPGDTEKR